MDVCRTLSTTCPLGKGVYDSDGSLISEANAGDVTSDITCGDCPDGDYSLETDLNCRVCPSVPNSIVGSNIICNNDGGNSRTDNCSYGY